MERSLYSNMYGSAYIFASRNHSTGLHDNSTHYEEYESRTGHHGELTSTDLHAEIAGTDIHGELTSTDLQGEISGTDLHGNIRKY